jgi:hypothetical protein
VVALQKKKKNFLDQFFFLLCKQRGFCTVIKEEKKGDSLERHNTLKNLLKLWPQQ